MRKALLGCIAGVAAIAVVVGTAGAAGVPTSEKRLVSGEVVSLSTYMMKDLRGEEGRAPGAYQVEKLGLPLAIIEDETDEIFIAVWKGPRSAQDKLLPLMGLKINAQGPVFERGGVKLIEIQVVAEQ